jgi:hypothetical protein
MSAGTPAAVFEAHRQREIDEHMALIRATFATPAGQALLAVWRRRAERPSYRLGETLEVVAWREGQKEFLREIDAAFAAAQPRGETT